MISLLKNNHGIRRNIGSVKPRGNFMNFFMLYGNSLYSSTVECFLKLAENKSKFPYKYIHVNVGILEAVTVLIKTFE